jgi:hypothetical protein
MSKFKYNFFSIKCPDEHEWILPGEILTEDCGWLSYEFATDKLVWESINCENLLRFIGTNNHEYNYARTFNGGKNICGFAR